LLLLPGYLVVTELLPCHYLGGTYELRLIDTQSLCDERRSKER